MRAHTMPSVWTCCLRAQRIQRSQHGRTAHLVDVFEFVYDLADDRLGWLVAPGLRAGVRSLRAGKPDGSKGKSSVSECRRLYW